MQPLGALLGCGGGQGDLSGPGAWTLAWPLLRPPPAWLPLCVPRSPLSRAGPETAPLPTKSAAVLPADLAQPASARGASSYPGRPALHVLAAPFPYGAASYLPGASGHLTMSLSLTNFSCAPHSSLGSARVPVAGRSRTGSFVAAFGLRVLGTEPVGRGPRGPPRCRAQCGVLYLQRGTEAQQQPRDEVTTVTSVLTGDSTRHG